MDDDALRELEAITEGLDAGEAVSASAVGLKPRKKKPKAGRKRGRADSNASAASGASGLGGESGDRADLDEPGRKRAREEGGGDGGERRRRRKKGKKKKRSASKLPPELRAVLEDEVEVSDDEEVSSDEDDDEEGEEGVGLADEDEDSGEASTSESSSGGDSSEDDSDDEDEGEEGGKGVRKRRLRRRRDDSEEVDEDDMALIAEGRREGLIRGAGGLEEGLEDAEEEEDEGVMAARREAAARGAEAEEEDEVVERFEDAFEDDDEMDGFIVDDSGLERRRRRANRGAVREEGGVQWEQLQAFESVFGAGAGDFFAAEAPETDEAAIGELERLFSLDGNDAGRGRSEAVGGAEALVSGDLEDEEDDEDFVPGQERKKEVVAEKEEEEGGDVLRGGRTKMGTGTRRTKKVEEEEEGGGGALEVYEPAARAEHFATKSDERLRTVDCPERLVQLLEQRAKALGGRVTATGVELVGEGVPSPEEVRWVTSRVRATMEREAAAARRFAVVAAAVGLGAAPDVKGVEAPPSVNTAQIGTPIWIPSRAAVEEGVRATLRGVYVERLEPVWLWLHRRDSFPAPWRLRHLWTTLDESARWLRVDVLRRTALRTLEGLADRGLLRAQQRTDMIRAIRTAAETDGPPTPATAETVPLTDVVVHARFEALRNHFRTQSNRSNVNSSSSSGVADAIEVAPSLVGGRRGQVVAAALRAGIDDSVVGRLSLAPDALAENIRANARVWSPPELSDEDVSAVFSAACGTSGALQTSKDVRRAAVAVAASAIARHPWLRARAREVFFASAAVSTRPTSKGQEVLEPSHWAFGLHVLRGKPLEAFAHFSPPITADGEILGPTAMHPTVAGASAAARIAAAAAASSEIVGPAAELNPVQVTAATRGVPGGGDFLGLREGYGSGTGVERVVAEGPVDFGRVHDGLPPGQSASHQVLGVPPGGVPRGASVRVLGRHEPRLGGEMQWLELHAAERAGLVTVTVECPDERLAGPLLDFALSSEAAIASALELAADISKKSSSSSAAAAAAGDDQDGADELSEGGAADAFRRDAVLQAVRRIWIPEFENEARLRLLERARDAAAREYACVLRTRVLVAPRSKPPPPPPPPAPEHAPDLPVYDAEEDAREGTQDAGSVADVWRRGTVRVLAAAEWGEDAAAVVLSPTGEVVAVEPLDRRRERRVKQLASLCFIHAPDLGCVLPAAAAGGGAAAARSARFLREAVMDGAELAADLVSRARRGEAHARQRFAASVLKKSSSSRRADDDLTDEINAANAPDACFRSGGEFEDLAEHAARWTSSGEWARRAPRLPPRRSDILGGRRVEDSTDIAGGSEGANTFEVDWADDQTPLVYATSHRAATELPDASSAARAAVGAARYLQNPLLELCALFELRGEARVAAAGGAASRSESFGRLRLHPCQSRVPTALLERAAERVLAETVAAVGVDPAAAAERPHHAPVLQFLPGLGPRKAAAFVRELTLPAGEIAPLALRSRAGLAFLTRSFSKAPVVARNALPSLVFQDPAAAPLPLLAQIAQHPDQPTPTEVENIWARPELRAAEAVAAARDALFRAGRLPGGDGGSDAALDLLSRQVGLPSPLDGTRVPPEFYDVAVFVARAADTAASEDAVREGRERSSHTEAARRVAVRFGASVTIPRNPTDVDPAAYARLWRGMRDETRASLMRWCANRASGESSTMLSESTAALGNDGSFLRWHPLGVVRAVLGDGSPPPPTIPVGGLPLVAEEPTDVLATIDLTDFARSRSAERGPLFVMLERIKAELRRPFADPRSPKPEPSAAALFRLDTGEAPSSLRVGSVVAVRVARAKASFLTVRLVDTGVLGHVPAEGLREEWGARVDAGESLEHLGIEGLTLSARITEVQLDRRAVRCSLRAADILEQPPLPLLDPFADRMLAKDLEDRKLERRRAASRAVAVDAGGPPVAGSFVARTIGHAQFRNVTREQAEEELAERPNLECLLRPSRHGTSQLTLDWKIRPGVVAHFPVMEEDKDPSRPLDIGRRLIIMGEAYSNIDELLVRHMDEMGHRLSEMAHNPKYLEAPEETVEAEIERMIADDPNRIPYLVSPSTKNPAFLRITYFFNNKLRHEYIRIHPRGFLWRDRVSPSPSDFFNDFKHRMSDKFRRRTSGPGSAAKSMRSRRSRWDSGSISSPTTPSSPESSGLSSTSPGSFSADPYATAGAGGHSGFAPAPAMPHGGFPPPPPPPPGHAPAAAAAHSSMYPPPPPPPPQAASPSSPWGNPMAMAASWQQFGQQNQQVPPPPPPPPPPQYHQ